MVDIHPPSGPVHSVKDFLFHMLTVVLGILIALSLEALMERRHHRLIAEEARANLILEIRDNRDHLQKGLTLAPNAESRLKGTMEQIEKYRRNHVPSLSGLDWSFGVLPLSDTAWKAAASTGAVTYMDYSEVPRYTRIYMLQELFLSEQRDAVAKWLDLQKWAPRLETPNGISRLGSEDLARIEDAASTALIYTQTEEEAAKTLVGEYTKLLDGK